MDVEEVCSKCYQLLRLASLFMSYFWGIQISISCQHRYRFLTTIGLLDIDAETPPIQLLLVQNLHHTHTNVIPLDTYSNDDHGGYFENGYLDLGRRRCAYNLGPYRFTFDTVPVQP